MTDAYLSVASVSSCSNFFFFFFFFLARNPRLANSMTKTTTILAFCVLTAISITSVRAEEQTFASYAKPLLAKHCLECHGADLQEGGVAFHELTGVDADNAALWKRVWEQVAALGGLGLGSGGHGAGQEGRRQGGEYAVAHERCLLGFIDPPYVYHVSPSARRRGEPVDGDARARDLDALEAGHRHEIETPLLRRPSLQRS